MPTTHTNTRKQAAEVRKQAAEVLERAKKLLAEVASLQERHAEIRAQLPFEPGEDALAWLRKNIGNHPRIAEEYQKLEEWKKSLPALSVEADQSKSGRRNWQAV